MSEPYIPACLVDPTTLPPPLLTSATGSFAHHTMAERVPRIVEDTIAANQFPEIIRAALAGLRDELLHGTTQPLREETPDRAFWDEISAPHLGRSWLDVPWYWAEAFFYRRLLEATTYFRPGPWQGKDPFAPTKETEWLPEAAPRALESLLQALPVDPGERFATLLQASLWGNRVDLSYSHVMAQYAGRSGEHEDGSHDLLLDDTARVWAYLQAAPAGAPPGATVGARSGHDDAPMRRLTLVADNTGTELAMDLALLDFLLDGGLVAQIHLHLKPQPFFVSDAMPADLQAGLAALEGGGPGAAALGRRIREHMRGGRLVARTHWFYTTCLHYFHLPDDLRADLAASTLVIVKGDANYRRLLGDALWQPTTPFARVMAYFPARLVALRTLKAEIITGLRPGQAETLQRADPQWLVNGRRGVIQANF